MLTSGLSPSTRTVLSVLRWMRHRHAAGNAAWLIKLNVARARAEREAAHCFLSGSVQLDDACIGGERNGCKTDYGVMGVCWANAVLANGKRATSRLYRTVKQANHALRHCAAARNLFGRRFHLAAMLPRMMYAAMLCDP